MTEQIRDLEQAIAYHREQAGLYREHEKAARKRHKPSLVAYQQAQAERYEAAVYALEQLHAAPPEVEREDAAVRGLHGAGRRHLQVDSEPCEICGDPIVQLQDDEQGNPTGPWFESREHRRGNAAHTWWQLHNCVDRQPDDCQFCKAERKETRD